MSVVPPEGGPPRPERVHSGGKARVSLLALVVGALVAIAVLKPWAGPAPPPLPSFQQASPTPNQAAHPDTSARPGPTVKVDPLAAIDWSAMGAALSTRNEWGIRAVVYGTDNTLREGWTVVKSADADVRSAFSNADAYAIVGWSGMIAAVGITTPLDDLPLDVRVWSYRAGDSRETYPWAHVAVLGLTPSGDPSSRLLLLAPEWTGGNGWPYGEYEFDVLLESGVRHIHVWLDGEGGPILLPPEPRQAPSEDDVRAMAGAPGAFIMSGTDRSAYLLAGLARSDVTPDEHQAWLRPTSIQAYWPPGPADPEPTSIGTANLIGAVVGPEQVLLDARLSRIAPEGADLGSGRILPGAPGPNGRPGAVVAFHPADPSVGFPDAIYRIDAHVYTIAGRLPISWDVPVLTHDTSTESPLLSADREWAQAATGEWALLIPGYPDVKVAPSASTSLPASTANPGDSCGDAPVAGRTPPYIGIAHPGPAFARVAVQKLGQGAEGAPLAMQVSQLADGVVALRPVGTNWEPGGYAAMLHGDGPLQAVLFCVH